MPGWQSDSALRLKTDQKILRRLKVALVSDDLTRCCLRRECRVWDLTPLNYALGFRIWKPDLLFVESAWQGWRNSWKYRIAAYPGHPDRTNAALARMVAMARDLGIPTVFWNKEDGIHFNRFAKSAVLFDSIFTVDENCVPAYKRLVGPEVRVGTLMFGIQPAIHFALPHRPRHARGCFVGSYSSHIHERRRAWQDMIFRSSDSIGITVFDRNSGRKSPNYRYPSLPGLEIRPAVPHEKTAQVYRDHLFSLNVNTVDDSPSMFSRRLIEIMACGSIAVTNPSAAIVNHFDGLCHVVGSEEEARELFSRLRHGPSKGDLEMARAAAATILAHHTWENRLGAVCNEAGIVLEESRIPRSAAGARRQAAGKRGEKDIDKVKGQTYTY